MHASSWPTSVLPPTSTVCHSVLARALPHPTELLCPAPQAPSPPAPSCKHTALVLRQRSRPPEKLQPSYCVQGQQARSHPRSSLPGGSSWQGGDRAPVGTHPGSSDVRPLPQQPAQPGTPADSVQGYSRHSAAGRNGTPPQQPCANLTRRCPSPSFVAAQAISRPLCHTAVAYLCVLTAMVDSITRAITITSVEDLVYRGLQLVIVCPGVLIQ